MTKSYCSHCGSEIEINNEFCNSCGSRVESIPGSTPSQSYPAPPPQQQHYPPPTQQYGASAQTTYVQPGKPASSQTDVFGIISLVMAFVGFISIFIFAFITPVFYVVGVILGIVGMNKSPTKKGLSIAGLILNIIGIVLSIIVIVLLVLVFTTYYPYMY